MERVDCVLAVPRICLIHWKPAEAEECAARLRAAGHEVVNDRVDGKTLAALRKDPPDAVVIDLSRQPMQGRDVGMALRTGKATRRVPLVFAGGLPEKVERVKQQLPDAVYTPWSRIKSALRRALSRAPGNPVVPTSNLAGYSGTPLPKKLGIKPGTVVGLLGAPEGFEEVLGELPEGAVLRRGARGRCELLLWFARSSRDLQSRIERMAERTGPGGVWILWPKQASGVATDLTQAEVRRTGLANGLVDYKIAAIDATWSGLRFARRKPG